MSVPPTAPLSAWTPTVHGAQLSPVAVFADKIDPATRDWSAIDESADPVDAWVGEAFAIERDSGPSVMGMGHRFREIRHIDETTTREIRDATHESLRELERARLLRFEGVAAESEGDASTMQAKYRNLSQGNVERTEPVGL